MIYNIRGASISGAGYRSDGTALSTVYDIKGVELFFGLVIMSYNVQWFSGLNSDLTMQKDIISTYNADIIGIQEFQRHESVVIPDAAYEVFSPDYPYIEIGNYANKNGVVSKYQLQDFTTNIFTTSNQSYCTATVTINGNDIFLIDTHFATSSYEADKVQQAVEIFDALQGHEYFILIGDFNTVCKTVSDTEYTTIMKQFVDAGYNIANCSNQHGFIDTWTDGHTSGGTWYPCDHIITSSNIRIESVIADQRKITVAQQTGQSIDHLPLIAYCALK